MPTFKLTLAYDGTDFAGWQWQPGRRTRAGGVGKGDRADHAAEDAVRRQRADRCGRACLGQVVSFRSDTNLDGPALCKALNAELPDDMLVFEVSPRPDDFHAIRDAVRKRYRYVIQDGRPRDIFDRKYVWHVYQRLDVEAMAAAARSLVGTHDFISFQTSGSIAADDGADRLDLLVERRQAELTDRVVIEVEADGFLYNMVRNIVGTLVEVGKGKQPIELAGRSARRPRPPSRRHDRAAAGAVSGERGVSGEIWMLGCRFRIQPNDCRSVESNNRWTRIA